MSLPRLTVAVSLALALSVPAVAQADRAPTRGGAWRFVTAGSSFDCPVPDVPRRIAKDLKIPCEPRP